MTQFKTLLISLLLVLQVLGAGSYFKGPGLIEGFTTVTSAAGTTTLTKDSETKQILTGATTQTFVLPDATTLPLGRYFNMINKSSGIMTVQTSGGGALTTVDPGVQKEVHLRAAGSAAGTWDVLAGGGGGVWGSITGTLSAQTDLNTALGLKAPSASPTFTGTIGTPLTASKLLATDASGNLTATAANSSQATYLDLTSSAQTQLNGKLSTSNYSAKGDLVAGVSSGVVAGLTVGSNGKVLTADSNATNGLRWDDPKVNKNYVTNGNAEGGVSTGWSTYADAAGTQPVDCTGGTPNSTWAASASSTIHGSNNFLATLNTGATRQGEGVSYAFTVDSGDSPAMMSIRFYYKVAGGTFAAGNDADRTSAGDSDYTVWVYDVTNGVMIQPSTYRLYSNSTTISEPFVANFQTASNSTSYRLCIHKGTSTSVSGTNITVRFDDFEVSRSNIALNTPISDVTPVTMTLSNTGNATISAFERRVGDKAEYTAKVTMGSSLPTGTIVLNLPSGRTVDSNKINTSGLANALGTANALAGGGYRDGTVTYNSSTSVFIISPASTSASWNATIPATWSNGEYLTVNFSVPITGWSSSTQVSDGYDGREISFSAEGVTSNAVGANTVVSYNTVTIDKTNSYNTTTDVWTAPTSGTYEIYAQHRIITTGIATVNQFAGLLIQVDSVTKREFYNYVQNTGISSWYVNGSYLVNLTAGQGVRILADTNITNPQLSTDPTQSYVQIKKLQAPTTMSATEVVAASYQTDAAQSLTSAAVLKFEDKVFDTHNAYNTTTGVYTAPVQGLYAVSFSTFTIDTTTGQDFEIAIRKNSGNVARFHSGHYLTTRYSAAGTFIVSLLAGETIDIYNTSSFAAGTLYSSGQDNFFSIQRIK